jgi:alpha-L-rhamnosidase
MGNRFQVFCEYQSNPVGIDCPAPRFSWIYKDERTGLRQAGYRVTVAKSAQALDAEKDLYWDPGRIPSDQT